MFGTFLGLKRREGDQQTDHKAVNVLSCQSEKNFKILDFYFLIFEGLS